MHKPLWYHYWLFHERKGLFQNKGWCIHCWNDLTLMAKKKIGKLNKEKIQLSIPEMRSNVKVKTSQQKQSHVKGIKENWQQNTQVMGVKYHWESHHILQNEINHWNTAGRYKSQREVGSLGNLKIRENNFSFPCTWGYFLFLRKTGICLLPKCILCTLPSSNMHLYPHIFSPHPSLILLFWLITRSLSFWEKENVFCNTGFTKFQLVINYYFPNTDRMFAFLKVLRMHLPGGSRKITYPITVSISSCDKIN